MTSETARKAGKPVEPPHVRRLRNLAAFWQQRYAAVNGDHGELARVSYERARAAATRAVRAGNSLAMYELAEALTKWAEAAEQAEARRQARDAS